MDKDKLSEEEKTYIAPCGIYCGACDAYLGKSIGMAKEMYRIMNGFNIVDVAPVVLGEDQEKVKTFMKILKKWSKGKPCKGCNGGGGNPMCGMKNCVKENNYVTCAECDEFPCQPSEEDMKMPLMNKAGMMKLISTRYGFWNQENIKEIKKIGYKKFIEKMQKKVEEGFMTSDVITKEKVFTEAMEKMKK